MDVTGQLNLTEYDYIVDSWPLFKLKLAAIFAANKVTDDKAKKEWFLAVSTMKTLEFLNNLVLADDLGEAT